MWSEPETAKLHTPSCRHREEPVSSCVAEWHSLQQCWIMMTTAGPAMSLHVGFDSVKYTRAKESCGHARVLCRPGRGRCGPSEAPEQHGLARRGKRCPQRTLRGCSRATRALLDLPRTLPTHGRHRQCAARLAALAQRAHSLRGRGASLRRRLRYGGHASTPSSGMGRLTMTASGMLGRPSRFAGGEHASAGLGA